MADNRPIAYKEGDRYIFRASSLGRSVRCLVASLNGYTPLPAPEYLLKAAREGNRYEPIVKDMLRAQGYKVFGEQDEIEIMVTESLVIRGHLDSWHIIDGDRVDRILEVKSMSDGVFTKWIRGGFDDFPEYAAQLTCYMEAAQRPALYAVINRETEQLITQTVDTPPMDFKELRHKVLLANYYRSEGILPTCDSRSQYTCPYDYLCDLREILYEEVESGSEAVLIHLATEYDEVRKLEKELAERKKGIASELRTALGTRSKVRVGDWSIANTESTRRTLDEAALREEVGERLNEFYKENTFEVLRVTGPRST